MKKTIIIFVSVAITLLVSFIYYTKYSEVAQKALENVEKSKKVKVGMSVVEVKEIMGNPDDVYPHYSNENISVFFTGLLSQLLMG